MMVLVVNAMPSLRYWSRTEVYIAGTRTHLAQGRARCQSLISWAVVFGEQHEYVHVFFRTC